MMYFTSIYRILRTSAVSLWRNRWLSLGAVLIMVMTLFSISFFTTLLVVSGKMTVLLREKVDIAVYFNDDASKDQVYSIQNTLLGRDDIKSVDYISKEKALERWQERNKSNENVKNIITADYNPLPRSLEIKTDKTEDLEKVYDFVNSAEFKPLIKEISYQKNKVLINRLIKATTFIKYIGWAESSIFILISILIIYNTIRLTIYARSQEIEIMKLVGASDWYVQGPFIVEGIAYGLVASIISTLILWVIYHFSLPSVEGYLGVTLASSIYSGVNIGMIFLFQIIIGLALGTGCSMLAVKKYLK
ncbi:MAG: permease-like cell division protein FtsX [Patescibacteria group bacterium]|jgi:cell division transport system permease protein